MPIKRGTKLKPYPGDSVLRVMYVERKMAVRKVALALSIGSSTVRSWLKQAGIEARSISEAKQGQRPAPHTVEASVRARRKHQLPDREVVGYKVRSDGYVYINMPSHPFATKSGYVLEHRLVVEKRIGRYLLPGEDVHHRNGKRDDNRDENLHYASHSDHLREHYRDRGVDPKTGRFR